MCLSISEKRAKSDNPFSRGVREVKWGGRGCALDSSKSGHEESLTKRHKEKSPHRYRRMSLPRSGTALLPKSFTPFSLHLIQSTPFLNLITGQSSSFVASVQVIRKSLSFAIKA